MHESVLFIEKRKIKKRSYIRELLPSCSRGRRVTKGG